MASSTSAVDAAAIARRILVVRGQRVLLDSDLAELYQVPTERLNQLVRRNRNRFPADFMFLLEINELDTRCLHFASTSRRYRNRRNPPLAFTEHGAIMAATVLNSPRAVEMSVYAATLDTRTRKQFEEVYAAIRALMAPPAAKSRPIGFTADIAKKD